MRKRTPHLTVLFILGLAALSPILAQDKPGEEGKKVVGKPGDKVTAEGEHGGRAEASVTPGCCSCVEKLELKFNGPSVKKAKSWRVADEEAGETSEVFGQDSYGHEFKLFVHYRNKRIEHADEKPGDLTLTWKEKSDHPPNNNIAAGVKPNEWANIPEVLGAYHKTKAVLTKGTWGPWTRHHKTCPLPPAKVELTDTPRVPYGNSRTMDFEITAASADKCHCKHKTLQITAQQVLKDNPRNKDTKFYAPPGTALKNGDVVQGKEL